MSSSAVDDVRLKCSNRGKITQVFGDIVINSDFDSGNLDRAEECRPSLGPGSREFNVWTAPDCAGLPCESGCRSWFYFSVSVPPNSTGLTLRFNVQNLNNQRRLYQQGLTPITKTVPGRGGWERLRERVDYEISEEGVYVLSFQATIPDSRKQTLHFAFCYPHSYTDCQKLLSKLDEQYSTVRGDCPKEDRIYYHRELVCRSLEGRRVDLLTVSSYDGMTNEREPRLDKLFPDLSVERAYSFTGKKVMFVSSRVHPGESPSSHVFNGFLQFILRCDDSRAVTLRKHFVFKLIPMLNPDGVSRGHYRMDTQGVNLNRTYLDPTFEEYPSIFAARSLIIYHHKNGLNPVKCFTTEADKTNKLPDIVPSALQHSANHTTSPSLSPGLKSHSDGCISRTSNCTGPRTGTSLSAPSCQEQPKSSSTLLPSPQDAIKVTRNSGIAFYIDLHAHATKRGCFFYGNYFSDVVEQAENMLFPKLVSLNCPHFDFDQCVFSEKNMYTRDKQDGSSKEGSGRVAMYKATGIIHSYTLECNYNSGRRMNCLGAATLADGRVTPPHPGSPMARRFSIQDFEQVGHALAVAALDFYQLNPWTRLPNTEYKSLAGLRESLVQRIGNTRTKRAKLTSAKQTGPRATEEVEDDVSSEALPEKTFPQPSKVKTPQTLWMSKGSASVAYEIQLDSASKRGRRRPSVPKNGPSKWRGKQRGGDSAIKQPVELSMPSAIKPSVQDVVFPYTLRMDSDAAGQILRSPRVGTGAGQPQLEVPGTNHRVGHFPSSTPTSLRMRSSCIGKDLRRTKTDPLPAIHAVKQKITVAGCTAKSSTNGVKKTVAIQPAHTKVLAPRHPIDKKLEYSADRRDSGVDLPLTK